MTNRTDHARPKFIDSLLIFALHQESAATYDDKATYAETYTAVRAVSDRRTKSTYAEAHAEMQMAEFL